MRRRSLALLTALVLVSALSGCGRLFGQRYNNFTAYYNTYYNAREEFEREEEKLLRQVQPVELDRFLPLFIEPAAQTGQANAGFENAVTKGADLLREHPESKWVDDALLLIGKARYYQADWTGAEEKFREVLALGEGKLEAEAWLWLGRTLTSAERYDDAAQALREGLERDERSRWGASMRLALAEVDVRRGDLDEAASSLEAGLQNLRDKELAARAAFLLGQVQEARGEPAAAAEAYGRTLTYGPRYELAYAAQLSQALALGLGGEPDPGLEVLRRMRRDDKNFENLAEVELTRARVLAAAERPAEARDLLRRLLYDRDPNLRIGGLQGRLHYYLADIYRDGLGDYVRAAAHYDTSATTLRRPPSTTIRYTPAAITDAQERADSFGSYARASASIAEMDSLLYLGSLDDEEFNAIVEQVRAERRAVAQAEQRDLARRRAEQGFGGTTAVAGGFGDRGAGRDPGGAESDAGGGDPAIPAVVEGEAGFLAFRDPVRVQDQLIGFQARWGERPYVPNWRRAAAIGGELAVGEELEESLEGAPSIETGRVAGDEFVDTSDVPRDAVTQQEMRIARATTRYELGNVLFLSLGEAEAAAPLYRQIIEEEGDSPLAQRAYFALAEAQRSLGNEADASDLYREVIDRTPESTLADQARERLGLAARERSASPDSLAQAEAAYALAYADWQDGEYARALDQMLSVGERYPTTLVAARARLAAGSVYTEWAAGDTTALTASLPILLSARDAVQPPPTEDADSMQAAAPVTLPLPTPGSTVYTWVVASDTDSLAAAAQAAAYQAQGFEASVLPATLDGQTRFRVGIGRHATREGAQAARADLPAETAADTWLLEYEGRADSPLVQTTPSLPTVPEPAVADSSMVREAPPVVADSTGLALADSTGLAAADSTGLEDVGYDEPWLEALYASIAADYPGTPYAERAQAMRTVLRSLLPEAEDAVADSVAVEGIPERQVRPATDVPGMLGEPINLSEGGYAWAIYAAPNERLAEARIGALRAEGYRVGFYIDQSGGRPIYQVLVGQFASEEEARDAEGALPTPGNRIVLLETVDELLSVPGSQDARDDQ